jgi:hypothetical protein
VDHSKRSQSDFDSCPRLTMALVFSVPIFFIIFRETLEASIVISVLLSLVDQLVADGPSNISTSSTSTEQPSLDKKRLKRRLRIQVCSFGSCLPFYHSFPMVQKIFIGCFAGFFLALAIGAAFIVVWFKKASNLWAKTEELWEGVFRFFLKSLPNIFLKIATLQRCTLAHRCDHHFLHGHHNAPHGSRRGEMARQNAEVVRRTSFVISFFMTRCVSLTFLQMLGGFPRPQNTPLYFSHLLPCSVKVSKLYSPFLDEMAEDPHDLQALKLSSSSAVFLSVSLRSLFH